MSIIPTFILDVKGAINVTIVYIGIAAVSFVLLTAAAVINHKTLKWLKKK